MNKRPRDNGRIYLSGSKKTTKAKIKQASHEKDKGSLERFVTKSVTKYAEENINLSKVIKEIQIGDSHIESDLRHFEKVKFCKINDSSLDMSSDDPDSEERENCNLKPSSLLELTDDPATWSNMNQCARDYLMKKGPPTIIMEIFPKNNKGRHFSKFHCKRKLQMVKL